MSEHIDKTLSAIDQCLEGINPHEHTAQEIGRLAWEGMQDSIDSGYMTEEYATDLYRRWFGEPREN